MFRAYAKINIGLFVVERRADGYHAIETVFHRVDLWDGLTFTSGTDIRVVSSSPDTPSDSTNICHKAATLLGDAIKTDKGVHIDIHKQVPVGAGLGGGSADAAVVLRELPGFWGKTIDPPTLAALALRLGSDVPYFLSPGSAVGRGRGELLEYFPLDVPWTILLCNPNIHVSTAWAYGHVRPRTDGRPADLRAAVTEAMRDPSRLSSILRNDFEPAVFEEFPAIREVRDTMIEAGALFAQMSGSGSTVFGFFPDETRARSAGEEFRRHSYRISFTAPHFVPGGSS